MHNKFREGEIVRVKQHDDVEDYVYGMNRGMSQPGSFLKVDVVCSDGTVKCPVGFFYHPDDLESIDHWG
jgi:hypothetical protein